MSWDFLQTLFVEETFSLSEFSCIYNSNSTTNDIAVPLLEKLWNLWPNMPVCSVILIMVQGAIKCTSLVNEKIKSFQMQKTFEGPYSRIIKVFLWHIISILNLLMYYCRPNNMFIFVSNNIDCDTVLINKYILQRYAD